VSGYSGTFRERSEAMAYENLLKSVEESAQEREQELREKAQSAVQAISEDTQKQATDLQQSLLAETKKAVAIEKNKRIYLTKGENKETLIKTKEKIVSKAFRDAEQRLSDMRNDPKYPAIFNKLAREAIEAVGGEKFHIHIDKRDEHLVKRILSDMNLTGEIIADLQCSGGLVVSTRNESVKISNTLESRLERVKERKKLEVYAVMYGD
jgi:V/A-type H+-transporting ATPase subunit E